MEILKAIILGVLEGITEFLPISSTGHLILANEFIFFSEDFTKKFDVIIQLGAILAVLVLYWKRLIPNKDLPAQKSLAVWSKVLLAVSPAIVIGGLFSEQIEALLFNPITVAIALIFWGVVLIVMEQIKHREHIQSIQEMTWKTALLIGFIQCLAMIPGTSRSAITIIGALLLGSSRTLAVEFSFFLAIPTMLAASAYSIWKIGVHISSAEWLVLAVGFLTAFLTAWLVIQFFLKYISQRSFTAFGLYRIALGTGVLLFFLTK